MRSKKRLFPLLTQALAPIAPPGEDLLPENALGRIRMGLSVKEGQKREFDQYELGSLQKARKFGRWVWVASIAAFAGCGVTVIRVRRQYPLLPRQLRRSPPLTLLGRIDPRRLRA